MSNIVENYYRQANVMPLLIKQKIVKLQRNPDILKEFEHWIAHKEYLQNGISVEGYTAKSLSELSTYVDGEAAFMLLVDLREAPEKALHKIKNGFKVK